MAVCHPLEHEHHVRIEINRVSRKCTRVREKNESEATGANQAALVKRNASFCTIIVFTKLGVVVKDSDKDSDKGGMPVEVFMFH